MKFAFKLLLAPHKTIRQFLYFFVWLMALYLIFPVSSYALSLPPNAKNSLQTQAEVTFYTADNPLPKRISSNIVWVNISPVQALAFIYTPETSIQPGQPFSIPLALRNTGNVATSYKLVLNGDLDDSLTLVLDTNKNGHRDDEDAAFDMDQFRYLDYADYDSLLLTGIVPYGEAAERIYKIAIIANTADSDVLVTANLILNVSSMPQIDVAIEASPRTLDVMEITTVTASIANSGRSILKMGKGLVIDGRSENVTLLRYRIPDGMRYVDDGSVQDGLAPSTIVLFAGSKDIGFHYWSKAAHEDVREIAIAVRSPLRSQESRHMKFKLQLINDAESQIISRAEGFDSASLLAVASNILKLDTTSTKSPDIVPFITQRDGKAGATRIEIGIKNIGTSATEKNITMRGEVPIRLKEDDVGGPNWQCTSQRTASGSTFQCINSEPLPVGGNMPKVWINVPHDMSRSGDSICGPDKKIIVSVSVPNEAQGLRGNNQTEASLLCKNGAVISGRAWIDAANDGVYKNGAELLSGWRAQLLRGGKVVKEALTDPQGQYRLSGIMPEHGYSLRFLSPQGRIEAPPLDSRDHSGALVIDARRDFINGTLIYKERLSPREYPNQDLALLPTGIIFDVKTAQPVANVKVTMLGPQGFIPQLHLVGPATNVTTMTDEKGRYNFFLTPDAPAGLYRWRVDADGFEIPNDDTVLALNESLGHSAADEVRLAYKVFDTPAIPSFSSSDEKSASLPLQKKHLLQTALASSSALLEDTPARTTGYFSMERVRGAKKVVNNHLGLNPLVAGGELSLQKVADRKTVELIDLFHYTLKVSHRRSTAFTGFTIADNLPRGLRYVPGSARLMTGTEGSVLADPAIAQGAPSGATQLTFDFAHTPLLPNVPVIIRYRVAVGATVAEGAQLVSYASATAGTESAQASARIRISGGVFSNDAFVLGKVFLDCQGDGLQDSDAAGVPGVRIYLEDGRFAETDRHGNYSLYGITPLTHVLKMDATTLPASARAQVLSNRHAGRGDLRFLDVRNGELGRGDFALSCNTAVQADVAYRRTQLAQAGDELDQALKLRFDAEVKAVERQSAVQGDRASGWIGEGSAKGSEPIAATMETTPASRPEHLSALPGTAEVVPASLSSPASLESLLRGDTALRIVNLNDGQILSSDFTDITVLGSNAGSFTLRVNGERVHERQVGQRSALESRHASAWTYIAVRLRSGKNVISVEQTDRTQAGAGLQSARPPPYQIEVIVPGPAARMAIEVPPQLVADGKSVVALTIALYDKDEVPTMAARLVELAMDGGKWRTAGIDPVTGNLQVLVKEGRATVLMQAPAQAGRVNLRVGAGNLTQTVSLPFEPALRPMVAAGIVEGIVTLNNGQIDTGRNGNNGFERELRLFSHTSANGKQNAAARSAFFLKGQVKGEYLLTAAFDSDKDAQTRLFRDIEPDKYYPVYGDDSLRGFDAQASSKLYLRIDKERSYLVYGDFNTGQSSAMRQLTQYSRAVNGLQHHLERGLVNSNFFASHDNLRQQMIRFRAANTRFYPGALPLSFVEGSERVELITEQRGQRGLEQDSKVLSRFTDYTIDELSGSLKVVEAVPGSDGSGEHFYRITFEVEDGSAQSWLYGGDVTVTPTAQTQIGVMAVNDANPNQWRRMQGVFGRWQAGPDTEFNSEMAWTSLGEDLLRSRNAHDSVMTGSGMGWRVGAKHNGQQLQSELAVVQTSTAFSNLSAPVAGGRFEARAKGAYKIDEATRFKAEVVHTRDRLAGNGLRGMHGVHNVNSASNGINSGTLPDQSAAQERLDAQNADGIRYTGALLGIERDLGASVKAEIGTRIVQGAINRASTSAGQGEEAIDLLTARSRISSVVPGLPKAAVYGEYEQDVRSQDKRALALGADYALSGKGRLYARHEVISSLGSAYEIEETARSYRTLLGGEGDYMEGGKAFSEYRGARPLTERGPETAYGTRNSWQINERLNLRSSVERTRSLSGGSNKGASAEATSMSTVIEYRHSAQLKGSTGLDVRYSTTEISYLSTLGVGYRLNTDWSVLGKNAVYAVRGRGADAQAQGQSDALRARQRIGMAYRDGAHNRANVLGYYEHRMVRSAARSVDDEQAHIVSLHANVRPARHWEVSARYAGKRKSMAGINGKSRMTGHLVSGRVTRDVGRRWDAGLAASLFADSMGQRKQAYGMEVGYQVKDDLWLSAGYNVVGFTDRDFASMAQTTQGLSFRLRFKFDEDSF